MSSQGPGQAPQPATLTSLPRVEDLPAAGDGYDRDRVREAFDAFRRHAAQLQAQLRVMQAAASTQVEPTGHAVRMDSLHLIRAAAEFADTLERDAQNASAAQLKRTEEEVRRRQSDLQHREADVEGFRSESERQRNEIVTAAKNEAREVLSKANAEASSELREAEARGARLLEQARHQATELTNGARAEVEQTLDWARGQAATILSRAQHGAEQLLGAVGLDEEAVSKVAEAIVRAAEESAEHARPAGVSAGAAPEPEASGPVKTPGPASRPQPTPGAGDGDTGAEDEAEGKPEP
jgi:cell division septum initiation protein DivIVA